MTATATSRRTAMGGTIASIIAGTVAAPAIAAAGSPDARLIALCAQLHQVQDDFAELFERCVTIEQERATEHEMAALQAREDALMAKIEAAGPPTTMRGVVAVARAALAIHHHRDADGVAIASDDSGWLLLQAAEALTGNA